MLKLHTCKLAHAHLLFALVITNTITLWAHFVHTCMDTPPLTTCMYIVLITGHNYYILLAYYLYSWPSPYRWPSPYTVGLLPIGGLLPILLAFSLYCWPSSYTVGLLPILLAFSLYSWPSPYTVSLLPVLVVISLYCWPSLKFFILSMHGITCSALLSLLSTVRLSTVVLQA